MQKYILKIKKEENINKKSSIQNQEENKHIKTKNWQNLCIFLFFS